MSNQHLNEKGFTLVELMVVVAIIGILSAVAIPNFKKYQAKSKTSEAKLNLSALYSAETALQSDYGAYAACLDYAGFDPNPDYYAVGFSSVSGTPEGIVNTNSGTSNCNTSGGAGVSVFPAQKNIAGVTVSTISGSATTNLGTPVVADNGGSFVAHAEGRISTDVS